MKKVLTIVFIGLLSSGAFAQGHSIGNQWMVAGLRGIFNSTWLLNQNQLNDKALKYKPSWGYWAGVMLGLHYTQWGAIFIEGYYATLSQKQVSAGAVDSLKWSRKTNLTYYDFPVLLHFVPREYDYVEAGIQYSVLANAKGSYNAGTQDLKSNFEKSNLAIVFGWGGPLWADGGGLLDLGIRLTYGLSDIIGSQGGKGNDYHSPGEGIPGTPKAYKFTNTATAGFVLSYNFDMGWWLHDSCKRKYKFFLFNHG